MRRTKILRTWFDSTRFHKLGVCSSGYENRL